MQKRIDQSKASRSINSKADGVMPAKQIVFTALQASAALRNGISNNTLAVVAGINFNTILVTTARVPSLPTIN